MSERYDDSGRYIGPLFMSPADYTKDKDLIDRVAEAFPFAVETDEPFDKGLADEALEGLTSAFNKAREAYWRAHSSFTFAAEREFYEETEHQLTLLDIALGDFREQIENRVDEMNKETGLE